MPLSRSAFVYIGAACCAIAAVAAFALRGPDGAETAMAASKDYSAHQAMLEGDMKKLRFHSAPKDVSAQRFTTADGGDAALADYQGRYVLLNFWATWCAPCRKEMPELSALQKTLGGADLTVLTVATGPNPPAKIAEFFDQIGVSNLPAHRDPRQSLARAMNILGLPVTAILNIEAAEIARLLGDANWHSESALAILKAVIAQEP